MQDMTANELFYPDLFHAVQTSGLFSDSKIFADAASLEPASTINEVFAEQSQLPEFDLAAFLQKYFLLPPDITTPVQKNEQQPVRDHINKLWSVLRRNADAVEHSSSLIALPHPYLVPGGRFREIYYWDSYFTMLGHTEDRGPEMLISMLDNFAFLIDRLGFVPNGNRSYFATRSQPPVLALMVEMLAHLQGTEQVYLKYLPYLEQEYRFWMDGSDKLKEQGQSSKRVIKAGQGFLNRYWDNSDQPRPESYLEDLHLAQISEHNPQELYRNIRAACESGWDFTTRWFAQNDEFGSIQTTQVVPVDLNSLLYKLELVLAHSYAVAGRSDDADSMTDSAEIRRELIRNYFYNEQAGFFVDLNLPDFSHRPVLSLAGLFPLYANAATPEQACSVAAVTDKKFLRQGGWVTSLSYSSQQWDAPNGWAPLQWVCYQGLKNYGFDQSAEEGARKWIDNNLMVYRATGKLLEKYNVEELGSLATGGEYAVQHGFGWTNGVLIKLMNELGLDSPA